MGQPTKFEVFTAPPRIPGGLTLENFLFFIN